MSRRATGGGTTPQRSLPTELIVSQGAGGTGNFTSTAPVTAITGAIDAGPIVMPWAGTIIAFKLAVNRQGTADGTVTPALISQATGPGGAIALGTPVPYNSLAQTGPPIVTWYVHAHLEEGTEFYPALITTDGGNGIRFGSATTASQVNRYTAPDSDGPWTPVTSTDSATLIVYAIPDEEP